MLFECLESNISQGLKTHGEFSITDAIDCMIKKGAEFKAFKVTSWYDCGKRDTLWKATPPY
jgi:glucose-1-phosphate thymidylyltransferase